MGRVGKTRTTYLVILSYHTEGLHDARDRAIRGQTIEECRVWTVNTARRWRGRHLVDHGS